MKRKAFFVVGMFLTFVATGYSQTKEEILAGKYDAELEAWPEGKQYSSEWRECQVSIKEVKENVAEAKKRAEKVLTKEEFLHFKQLTDLVLNDISEDVYKAVKTGDSEMALRINDAVKLEDLYAWDRQFASCKERIAKAEQWANTMSEAALQFPEEFKAGTMKDKLYAEKTAELFGKPTPIEDYSPYDSLLQVIGDKEEKTTLFIKSDLRKGFYEKIKPLYSKGLHEELVVTENSRIARTIVYTDSEFKVFERREHYAVNPPFGFIDGNATKDTDFAAELAKYKK